jgi:hypothetical protein
MQMPGSTVQMGDLHTPASSTVAAGPGACAILRSVATCNDVGRISLQLSGSPSHGVHTLVLSKSYRLALPGEHPGHPFAAPLSIWKSSPIGSACIPRRATSHQWPSNTYRTFPDTFPTLPNRNTLGIPPRVQMPGSTVPTGDNIGAALHHGLERTLLVALARGYEQGNGLAAPLGAQVELGAEAASALAERLRSLPPFRRRAPAAC